MPFGDIGINKPFDRVLKAFADEAPELFLRLLGMVPPGVEVSIQPLRPETAPAVVMPDYVALVQTGLMGPVIFHAEFESTYHHDLSCNMARYGVSLACQYQMTVESVLVLLRPRGVPAVIPDVGHYNIGKTSTTHPFSVMRLWEIDPTPVLETNIPKLLPWALLMKSTDEQVRGIASILMRQEDEEALGRFFTLGSIRYDKYAMEEMFRGQGMGLIRAIMEASWIPEAAREMVRDEARAEGRAEEARRFLRRLLRKNCPEVESMPEIDQISNVETLESLGESILERQGTDAIREAILSAAKPN